MGGIAAFTLHVTQVLAADLHLLWTLRDATKILRNYSAGLEDQRIQFRLSKDISYIRISVSYRCCRLRSWGQSLLKYTHTPYIQGENLIYKRIQVGEEDEDIRKEGARASSVLRAYRELRMFATSIHQRVVWIYFLLEFSPSFFPFANIAEFVRPLRRLLS